MSSLIYSWTHDLILCLCFYFILLPFLEIHEQHTINYIVSYCVSSARIMGSRSVGLMPINSDPNICAGVN